MPRRKQNPQSLKQTVSTAIKKIVWRVAIYIRLSKDDGNDESYSVKNQRERLNDTLEQLMLDEDGIEFVGYYIDDGFTGVDSVPRRISSRLFDGYSQWESKLCACQRPVPPLP